MGIYQAIVRSIISEEVKKFHFVQVDEPSPLEIYRFMRKNGIDPMTYVLSSIHRINIDYL